MKIRVKRSLQWLVVCMTLISMISITSIASNASDAFNAQSQAASSVSVEYYGRYALSLEPNAEALLYAYDQIYKGVETSQEKIKVYDDEHPLTSDELYTVFDAYTRDHTEQFWVGNSYSYSYTSTTVIEFMPKYIMSGNQLATAKAKFENAVNSFLSELNGNMSDFERELILHDKLAKAVTYIESSNAHNAYGAIVEGEAVCEGYAEAFQYLLHRAGIPSFVAVGSSVNPSSGSSEGHAWNYVMIDGKYYHTDVTWNDQGDSIFHSYFNQSDAEIQIDHAINATEYALPKCKSTDSHYFNVMDGKLTGTSHSVSYIANCLKKNSLQAGFYIQDDSVGSFLAWLKENIAEIGKKAGVIGAFKYRYSYLGKEFHLTVLPNCDHDDLTQVRATQATCTQNGNSRYYTCSCGRWFSDSGGKTEITDRNSVIVSRLGHNYAEKIADSAHLKVKAENCQTMNVYWYDCSRCASNAKNDTLAQDKYYISTVAGSHSFTEKIEDAAHLVAGSGADCKHVKRYYYDCADCNQIATTIWDSTTCGAHQLSAEWTIEEDFHYHRCTVSGCTHVEDKEKCSGGNATCTTLAVCATCQDPYGVLADHSSSKGWETDENQHWQLCDDCGEQFNYGAHALDEKWTTDGSDHWHDCSVCKSWQMEKAAHEYGEEWMADGQNHWKSCHCGAQSELSLHSDDDQNSQCDICLQTISVKSPDNEGDDADDPEENRDQEEPGKESNILIFILSAAGVMTVGIIVIAIVVTKKR